MRELFEKARTLFVGKNYLVFSVIMLVLVGLPLTVVVLQRQETLQQKASAATALYFFPDSTIQSPVSTSVDGTVSFDVMVNPGTNAVSAVRLEISYDPTKFGEITGTPVFAANPATFPQVTEGPTLTPGKIVIGLSIGSDPTRAITAISKVGTLSLKVTSPISGTSSISFGANSSATSITTTGTTANTNVLSSTSPAIVTTDQVTSPVTTVNIPVAADSYVDSSAPTNTHGSSTSLSVVGGTSPIKTAYLKFDLTSLASKTIQNAVLKLVVSNDSAGSQNIKSVSDTSWTEAGLTFNNKPAPGSVLSTISNTTTGQTLSIPLTSQVSLMKGKLMSLAIDSSSTNTFGFNSKEASSGQPVLVVSVTGQTSVTATPKPTATGVPSATPTATTLSSTPAPTLAVGGTCAAVATDTILVIDRSSSMKEEIAQAKTAAKLFVDQLAKNTQNKVGVVSFETNSVLVSPLSNNYAGVKSAIDGISLGSGTCTQCGIDKANTEIATNGRTGIKKVVVLLTDGRANRIPGKSVSSTDAEAAAITSVKSGNTAKGTSFFTIGLGNDVNSAFLQQIATITGGTYNFSPTADTLATIYQSISTIVGKGSITGTVFVDLNNNGVKDADEPAAVGWKVTLKTNTGTLIGTSTTTATGSYSFTGLCDGITYIASLTPQATWLQTKPANNGTYSILITNGDAVENKDFGVSQGANPTERPLPIVNLTANPTSITAGGTVTLTWTSEGADSCLAGGVETGWTGQKATSGTQPVGPLTVPETYIFTLTCTNSAGSSSDTAIVTVEQAHATATIVPTSTPVPTVTLVPTATTGAGETTLSFTVLLHSIGNSGDNVNPNAFSLSNKEPVHPQRKVSVAIYNAANKLEASASGLMTYASASGSFVGNVKLGPSVTAGSHIVTITTDSFLTNLFPGIQTISLGKDNPVPTVALVAGDINGDNKLNILDYNMLLGCYTSEDQPTAKSCDSTTQRLADLNDEGIVNRYDYNLFLRELSVQSGFSL